MSLTLRQPSPAHVLLRNSGIMHGKRTYLFEWHKATEGSRMGSGANQNDCDDRYIPPTPKLACDRGTNSQHCYKSLHYILCNHT
ncbi:hypothetical protein HZ326_18273 [Fusarium oxysporum f. sp. albedinis]|nr:hypothetical protein HZ326_18273 [Fusarium oxysporum f. sp. albedinis]